MTHTDVTLHESGDDSPPVRSTRRALFGAGVGASAIGAAFAGFAGRTVSAGSEPDADDDNSDDTGDDTGDDNGDDNGEAEPVIAPISIDDRDLMRAAMELEITARDLYDAAIEAGATTPIAPVMREQHEAFAQALAGATGFSANARNDDVFELLRPSVARSDNPTMLEAAYELESVASATHTELVGLLTDTGSVRLIASIGIMEARHAAVLADAIGGDLDARLSNPAEPLALEDLS